MERGHAPWHLETWLLESWVLNCPLADGWLGPEKSEGVQMPGAGDCMYLLRLCGMQEDATA